MKELDRGKPKSLYLQDDEIDISGYVRLIEGIILNALDKVSISAKWYNREITPSMLKHKMETISEIKDWLDSRNCDTWLGIYAKETHRSANKVKRGLKKVMRKSLKYIRKVAKEKNINLKKLVDK